ncbi:MAG TPA: YdcF family protein [Gemmatimonadales bacterium]|nr:YdcF family protein [Gemmatimonadales bacterium]
MLLSDQKRPNRLLGAGAGLVLAAASWLVLGGLGVPELAGMQTVGDLPWIALVGSALGALGLAPLFGGLLAIGVVAVFLVSGFGLLDNRIRDTVRSDSLPGGSVDAVVILAGNLTREGRIGSEALGRLLAGVELRRRISKPHLVLTSIHRVQRGDTLSSERDQRALIARFDPEAVLHVVGPVRNTHDEAVAVTGLARQRGWRRLAVVTSPLHTRRACATFERQGLAIVCRASDSRDYSLNLRRAPADRLEAFRDWLYETVGTRVYRARGWLAAGAKGRPTPP